jgi:hypothetical protein
MKKLIIFLIIISLPLLAEEISLGMVTGIKGDSLILVDGLKVHVPRASLGRYINENNQPVDAASISFPFTASLVVNRELPEQARAQTTMVKIHKFYVEIDGRLVERKSP